MLNLISKEELAVLSEVQRLPLVSKPFSSIAKRLEMDEDKILKICKDLLSKGIIRRFGLSLNHRKVGIRANLMVVANVPKKRIDEVGQIISAEKGVTHCYHRTGWDYNLFFMIHSKSKDDVIDETKKIIKKVGIIDYRYMFSTREFKKISFELPKTRIKPLNIRQNDYMRNKSFQLPVVLNVAGPVIIFGGGKVGLRKVDFVSKFSKDITVVSKETINLPDYVTFHLVDLKLKEIPKFIPDGAALVIAAFSDFKLNAAISKYCIQHKILVNVVDNPEISTILFPSLSKAGNVNIAVSTGGKCPFLSKQIRKYLDSINSEWANWLEILAPIRKNLLGIEEKNLVLSKIFEDPEVITYISKGDLENAKKKAQEVYNVHRKH